MRWMYKNVGDKNDIWTSVAYETKEQAIEAAWEVYHEESSTCTQCVYIEYQIGQWNPVSGEMENVEVVDVSEIRFTEDGQMTFRKEL